MNKNIRLSKKFTKRMKELGKIGNLRQRIESRIGLFIQNPHNPILKNHRLQGITSNYRSFSITGDIRIIYIEKAEYFLFIDIGTHKQVY